MKNKVYILLAVCAVVTLSFTFTSKNEHKVVTKTQHTATESPAGGLLSEDKF